MIFGRNKTLEQLYQKAPQTMCAMPFGYMNFWPAARFGPCCAARPSEEESVLNTADMFNSPYMRNIRSQMVKGQRPKACSECWKNEDLGMKSMRQESFERPYLKPPELILKGFKEKTGFTQQKPTALKISLSNLCNIQCRMCDAGYSSRWEAYYKDATPLKAWMKKNEFSEYNYENQRIPTEQYFEKIVDFVREHKDTLTRLEFIGGEPLIQPIHYRLLEEVKDRASNLELDYSSNMMKLGTTKTNIFEHWPKFKRVHLTVSIDGVGALNDYIRAGSNFAVLESNMKEVEERLTNVVRHSYTTISLYNIFQLTEIVKYATNRGYRFLSNSLHGPNFLSTQLLPLEAKNEIREHLEKFLSNLEQEMENSFSAHPFWSDPHSNWERPQKELQLELIRRRLKDAILFMMGADQSQMFEKFFEFDEIVSSHLSAQIPLKEVAPELIKWRGR